MKVSVAPLLKRPVGSHVDLEVEEGPPIDPRGENAELIDAGVREIDADIRATHTDPGAYLEGAAHARVVGECGRCLRPIELAVKTRFAEQYYATLRVEGGAAASVPPVDAKTIGSDFTIDLATLLCEEIILVTPQAALCRPDCGGLCLVCGEDLNERPHEHDVPMDQRWSTLSALDDLRADGDG